MSIRVSKMYIFWVILSANFLQLPVLAAPSNDLQLYLPFVLIQRKNSFVHPNVIAKGDYIENVVGFRGDVRFARNQNENQIFFCPPNTRKERQQITLANSLYNMNQRIREFSGQNKVDDKCLFKKTFKDNDILQCSLEAHPTIYMKFKEEDGESEVVFCGPRNRGGVMFKFVYEICPPSTFLERLKLFLSHAGNLDKMKFYRKIPFWYQPITVYEICYDMDEKTIMFTKHTPPSLRLLFDSRLNHERSKKFNLSPRDYTLFANQFIKDEKFYEENLDLASNEGDNSSNKNDAVEIADQEGTPSKLPFQLQFLVPPDDMPTAILRKPTFHYINVSPMHKNLINLWNFIEDTIREGLKENDIQYEIYTGVFRAPSPKDNLKIPDLWVKILYHDFKSATKLNPGIAILMINNEDYDRKEISLENYCAVDFCNHRENEAEGELDKKHSRAREIVRCCGLNQNILSLFNLKLRADVLLEIPGLTIVSENRDV